MLHRDGRAVHLSLDERTGAGFASQDLYLHGFFSANIKLPSDYAAGVVVAFYMSNGDVFEKTHDELDFEFLGNIRGKEWRVQTNIYGNGSTAIGREERYGFWFDPTEDFHKYSILWSHDRIIFSFAFSFFACFGFVYPVLFLLGISLDASKFENTPSIAYKQLVDSYFLKARSSSSLLFAKRFYIDNVPIREVVRTEAMGGQFPSKPMSLYATIWDGSNWATSGGRYKINYKYAPYIAEFADLILHGCAVDPMDHTPTCNGLAADLFNTITISADQRLAMERFRKKYMTYSYCYDRVRYSDPLSECSTGPEAREFQDSGEARFINRRHRHGKRHHRAPANSAI
ncbi:Xyloglucan endotransglucosylase/hydrolase [Cocos nucifera]|uniref:Xyloglucan endotransglucosylase/hydrolase n=1 Tax=Cocos nucifera TaxID=13894 RepID=A0A8K0N1Z7_COCNU|nr:Xyloglucan endotransglucosylase/hydrolase [Cocos nucifera]